VIEELPAKDTNLVAAIWYAEWCALQNADISDRNRKARQKWLETVRRAFPSCFCDPELLE
jgi:hypothetical protein